MSELHGALRGPGAEAEGPFKRPAQGPENPSLHAQKPNKIQEPGHERGEQQKGPFNRPAQDPARSAASWLLRSVCG